MKIEVKKFNAQRKFSGNLQFEYTPTKEQVLLPLTVIEGNVKVSADYEIYDDDSVGVILTISYKLTGQCSYCLEKAQTKIEKTFDILFVTEQDEENYLYDGNTINLQTAVIDAILFSQPNLLLCKDDCAGIDLNNK